MIEVQQAGALCTVQDLGRPGLRQYGIAAGGALDVLALQVANRLVGNPHGAAGLELLIGPLTLRFGRDGCLALAGADCAATLDGLALWPGWRQPVRAGQTLQLTTPHHGRCTYLAVDGGIDVPPVLGGRGTDLAAGLGGLDGRPLQAGDRLPQGPPAPHWPRRGVKLPDWSPLLRTLPGPDYADFDALAQQQFWSSAWQVAPDNDRTGSRLHGPALPPVYADERPSAAVLPGVVQVPPSGQPIALLADAPTTGGYPCLAVVIEADLWRLAQAPPGARLGFIRCDAKQAAAARLAQARYLRQLDWGLYGH